MTEAEYLAHEAAYAKMIEDAGIDLNNLKPIDWDNTEGNTG